MARCALHRRPAIEHHKLPLHHSRVFMAQRAAHVLMRPLQRKLGASFVVEQRRLPLSGVVAVAARRHFARDGKLLGVRVLVTLLTVLGRDAEIHVAKVGFERGRLVTAGAGRATMRSHQRERRLGVVEL